MLNLKAKDSHYIFDESGMLVVKGDERSWRDSIMRTVLAWIAYEQPMELMGAICSNMLWSYDKNRLFLYRHPDHHEFSSRDHWSYNIIFKKFTLADDDFYEFIEDCPRMRGMNLWMKSLTGNKRAEWWYYFWAIPFARFGNIFLRLCRRAGRIGDERENKLWVFHGSYPDDDTVGNTIMWRRTPRQKLWAKIIFWTIPAYALHVKAWQLYVMPEHNKRKMVQQILLKRVGQSNILVRLLLGDEVTQQEITDYPAMTGYRPGVYLDETCRRSIREMDKTEREFNNYELELIKWLYENISKTRG